MTEYSEFPETSQGASGSAKAGRASPQLDFELEFFQKVLDRDPSFVEVLRILGEELTRKGMYHRGLLIDQRLVQLRPNDAVARYNLACSYALLHYTRRAVQALRKALELGYRDRFHLENDSDLDNLREEPEYLRLMTEQGWE